MKLPDILNQGLKAISGKKTYAAVLIAAVYWIGADNGWWQRHGELDAAAFGAIVAALRAGSKTDRAKAVKAIKSDLPPTEPTDTPKPAQP